MKCPRCNGREFRVCQKDVASVTFDENDIEVEGEVINYGDTIKEDGYYCQTCDKNYKYKELIKEAKK